MLVALGVNLTDVFMPKQVLVQMIAGSIMPQRRIVLLLIFRCESDATEAAHAIDYTEAVVGRKDSEVERAIRRRPRVRTLGCRLLPFRGRSENLGDICQCFALPQSPSMSHL